MTGTINGYSVVWGDLAPGTAMLGAADALPFAEYQRAQYSGPAALTMRVTFAVTPELSTPVDQKLYAEAILHALRTTSICFAYEPTGILFGSLYAYLRIMNVAVKRYPARHEFDVSVVVLGSPDTHSIGLVASVKQLANIWGQAGVVALRAPASTVAYASDPVDDSTRQVIQSPAAFASMEAAYTPNQVLRNGLAPIEVIQTPSSSSPMGARVAAFLGPLASAIQQEGSGRNMAGSTSTCGKIESCALRASWQGTIGRVLLEDLTGGGTTLNVDFTAPATYASAIQSGAGLPGTPLRRIVKLDNGATLTFLDNGNINFDPGLSLPSVKFTGATATRALGTGVFYHQVKTGVYVIGTQDFAVDASGNLTPTAGGTYGFVFTALTGSTLTLRLREALMDVLPSWVILKRSR